MPDYQVIRNWGAVMYWGGPGLAVVAGLLVGGAPRPLLAVAVVWVGYAAALTPQKVVVYEHGLVLGGMFCRTRLRWGQVDGLKVHGSGGDYWVSVRCGPRRYNTFRCRPLLDFGFWSGFGHTFSRPPEHAPDAVHRIYHAIDGRLSAYRLRRATAI